MSEKRIKVEPVAFGMTGFNIDDLFTNDFVEKLKKEMPTSTVVVLGIGFTDSKDLVIVAHNREEGKYISDRVEINGQGKDSDQKVKCVVEVVKKVLA